MGNCWLGRFGGSLLPGYVIALWLLLAGRFVGSLLPVYVIALWLLRARKVLGVAADWVCDCTIVM
jgi:hypothetical protein